MADVDFLKDSTNKIPNTLCIDWFQATFKFFPDKDGIIPDHIDPEDYRGIEATPQLVAKLIGIPWDDFTPCAGQNMYKSGAELSGIKIFYDGFREGMGVNLCISGKGCRFFEKHGSGDWDGLIKFIAGHYSPKSCDRLMQITRIDLAYDDFNGVLPLEKISDLAREGCYVSRCHRNKDLDGFYEKTFFPVGDFDLGKSKVDLSHGCDEKHFTQSADPSDRFNGHTVYFGTRRSNMMLRFYDKKAEQERDDLASWTRCELVLRRSCANGFALKFLAGVDEDTGEVGIPIPRLYFGILNQYIRFVEPDPNDSNRRRWKTVDFWDSFINDNVEITVFIKPDGSYTSENLGQFVLNTCGTSIATYVTLFGVDMFFDNIDRLKKKKKLNKRHEILLRERFGEDWERVFKISDLKIQSHISMMNRDVS
jgi:phage replication initiation protein